QGMFQEANQSFQEAVKIDPDFTDAQIKMDLFKNKMLTEQEISNLMMKMLERTPLSRLENTGQNLVMHSLPIDADNPSASRPATNGTVVITGTLPAVDTRR
ncbi:hypothetical protein JW964_19475, partial [candidate division KSB1 bacterium]|nr:hypothetical protein [candidate division KSB1 bacterium]